MAADGPAASCLHPRAWADAGIDPAGLEDFQRWAYNEQLVDAVVPYSILVDDAFLEREPPSSTAP